MAEGDILLDIGNGLVPLPRGETGQVLTSLPYLYYLYGGDPNNAPDGEVAWTFPPTQNLLKNQFQTWGNNGEPDHWQHGQLGGTIEKVAGWPNGNGVKLTRSSTPETEYNVFYAQNPHSGVVPGTPHLDWWKGKTICFGAYVKYTETGDIDAGLTLTDAVNETHSTPHPGDGQWHWLTCAITINSAATQVVANCAVKSPTGTGTAASAEFSNPTLVLGSTCPAPLSVPENVSTLMFGDGATVSGTTNLGPFGQNTQPDYVSVTIPRDCVLRNLWCRAGQSPGTGESFTYTLVVSNNQGTSETALECSSTDGAQGALNDSDEIFVPTGSNIWIKVTPSSGAPSTYHRCSLEQVFI